jgi:hypothetical protein
VWASSLKLRCRQNFHCSFHSDLWDFKKSSILGPSYFPVKIHLSLKKYSIKARV